MKAVQLHERGPKGPRLTEIPVPSRPEGGVLVRMLAASVNRVDLYMRDSGAGISHELPLVMGVDGVGEVLEAGPDSAFRAGERVILYPYDFCGRCRYCAAGDQLLCVRARIFGEHRDGTFTEVMAVPEAALVRLSPDADVRQAAALGVAWLTAWRMIFGKAPAGPGQVVFIQGAGAAWPMRRCSLRGWRGRGSSSRRAARRSWRISAPSASRPWIIATRPW
ncbi:MAG TPA: alcohol dehydrogenase catalytic domain-containing protein [Paracoccus sp. (in: a-proteobacteria)]|nr:alcohol dehydrogenase catalytic domain-containing protein [Paracoccus sp. (in: a-proteobacteria)]